MVRSMSMSQSYDCPRASEAGLNNMGKVTLKDMCKMGHNITQQSVNHVHWNSADVLYMMQYNIPSLVTR